MKSNGSTRTSELGSAGTKLLIVLVLLVLAAHAGYNYIPVAYNGASFQQEMDTAVVKGLAAPGKVSPVEVVSAHVKRAAADNELPADAVIEVKQKGKYIQAYANYTVDVNILPFGIYKYPYSFEHTAVPTGYLAME